MIIYLGADHRGFALKEKLKAVLSDDAYTVTDLGAASYDKNDDYPDFAKAVGDAVAKNPSVDRGILICGSGFGVDIAANKCREIRAALPASPDHIYVGRHDDDVNVLALAADFMDEETVLKIVKVFLSTPFVRDERYLRRLGKISEIEAQ
jgi:ribose 5-phosphate isomerase B